MKWQSLKRNAGRHVAPCSRLPPAAGQWLEYHRAVFVLSQPWAMWTKWAVWFSSQVLERGSFGRRTRYQCQVQVLRILAESFDGKVKSVQGFAANAPAFIYLQTDRSRRSPARAPSVEQGTFASAGFRIWVLPMCQCDAFRKSYLLYFQLYHPISYCIIRLRFSFELNELINACSN